MPLQTINIGASANDGSGDPLRTAMDKINDNFQVVSGNVFNVRDPAYGAVGDGVTNDYQAIQDALDDAADAGGGVVYLPAGTYRRAKTSTTLVIYSNTTLKGDGDCSIILFDDVDSITRVDLMTVANTANVTLKDFKILGVAETYNTETNQSQGIVGSTVENIRVENVTFESLRFMAVALSYVKKGVFTGNTLVKIIRDGIRCTNSYDIKVIGNTFDRVSDDCVALHSLDAAVVPVGSGFIVTGNTITDSQGIKILGAKVADISNNTINRSPFAPIYVALSNSGSEGATPVFAVNIKDNIIVDTRVQGAYNNVIDVRFYPYEDAGLSPVQPGVNSSIFGYAWLNNIDASGVRIGAFGINICGNIIARSLEAVANYSDYGYGDLYLRGNGWPYDPAITDTDYLMNGISVLGAVQGLNISDNQISGLGAGKYAIKLSTDLAIDYADFNDVLIESNIIRDCPGIGIGIIGGDTSAARNLIIRNNIFDLDPFRRAATHNADNTWSSATAVLGVETNGTVQGFIATGNLFAHLANPLPSVAGVGHVKGNYILCDPSSAADNAANIGVRVLTRSHQFTAIVYK